MNNKGISVVWITPTHFLDNNGKLIPYLSKYFRIEWIIFGAQKPQNFDNIARFKNDNLTISFYTVGGRWYLPTSFLYYCRLFKEVRSRSCGIIYFNGSPQLWAFYAARCLLPKKSTVFAAHNVLAPKGARYAKMANYYMRALISHFSNFHVFSLNQKDYLESISSGKNIFYAPLPLIDFGRKEGRTVFLDRINFLAFGYIRKYKRFDLLIDAAQLLYEETGLPFVVTIVGKCNNWEEYSCRIKYPEIFNIKIGFVEDEKVPFYFSNCDYLVQPYQDLAQSGPLMLAYNYHIPVIASNIKAFREFVIDEVNGYLFETENVESLKEVMKKILLQDETKKKKMVESVIKYTSENYSMESLALKYNIFFESLLGE